MKKFLSRLKVKKRTAVAVTLPEMQSTVEALRRRYWENERWKEFSADMLILGSFGGIMGTLVGLMTASPIVVGLAVGGFALSVAGMIGVHMNAESLGKRVVALQDKIDSLLLPGKDSSGKPLNKTISNEMNAASLSIAPSASDSAASTAGTKKNPDPCNKTPPVL